MKLFSAAVLATAVTANLQGEYSKLARAWGNFNFNGENRMTTTRRQQKEASEDEKIMWDELHYMKTNYYGPLFCGPWKWGNSYWENVWCGYMIHWKNFESAYKRLMTSQTIREKMARRDAASQGEINWWEGKLDEMIKKNQIVMELMPQNARDSLNRENALNNYEKFTEEPNPAGWDGYYTRPTLSGTCYVTRN